MFNTNINYLVMDVDGTLTDGKIYMGNSGEVMKAFDVKDGYAIHYLLPDNNIVPVIITGRRSNIVENRCREIGVTEVHQGVSNKLNELLLITKELSSVAYIGDDISDLPIMEAVKRAGGTVGAPHNAVKRVLDMADYTSPHDGGDGAVRDFIEWIIGGER